MAEKRIEKLLAAYMPFPMCIINSQGKVTRANDKIDEVFIYDGIKDADIFALTGIKHADFLRSSKQKDLILSRNDKIFKIFTTKIGEAEDSSVVIYFHDITAYETLKRKYSDEKFCMVIVNVDNFDELSANTSDDRKAIFLSEIDKTIRQWAARMSASITRYKDFMYLIVTENAYCEKMIENKFSILDDIRDIETQTDFPVTLSIGIGIGGKTPAKTDEYAQAALDLALGRGGDQAVIKREHKIEYYGGKMQAVEKSNKGKSRIMAHAIKQLIDQSSKVLIMGHRSPDMDSFGAALGVFRLALNSNKEAHIIINRYNENMAEIYTQAQERELYSFISSEKAMAIVDKETLVIVVDTHRPSITECPELLSETDKIVVIDHHRRAEEVIENPVLAYMEPYASSSSELVTEVLQYSQEKKTFNKFEAEALLAGITVDTNRFASKAGVRTFEAASWLRRSGADISAVTRFFQSDAAAFKLKADCVANAEILPSGIAIAICNGTHSDIQIINSQAADMLLEIKDIKASIVVGVTEEGQTVISARSLGEVNVQVLMEEFGGGGHLATAGAQTELTPEEVVKKLKGILKNKGDKK